MFSIRYKVFFDEIYDDHELKGADGYFQIQVDNENYGLLLSEELDAFSVSVYWWFYYFLEATELLKNEKQVYISDIETPQVWIELKKTNSDYISISKAYANKPEGSHAVECSNIVGITYLSWNSKLVSLEDFRNELLEKSKMYAKDLQELNDEPHPYILKLEFLIKKVEN
ncbi:hypothetical protein QRE66_11180 [Bacillus cereus]|uniref:hypothetical protein n=1 Tax=Bacillus pseudomycoides TaxID=64104 RepID=UPI001FB2A6E0|nr:hypothetical protein [Bacillus pseudomycoides]WJE54735.1 hypothetical protein QRE66_11180 [Bacillus cereus]